MSSYECPGLISHRFQDLSGGSEVLLPFAVEDLFAAYDSLVFQMSRRPAPDAFSRDEWGYLLSFMRGASLRKIFTDTFGAIYNQCAEKQIDFPKRLIRPRADIAIWLPNNVSLLGPLAVVLALATGARVRAKAGSGAENLTAILRDTILESGSHPLLTWLWDKQLTTESFDRHDPRNAVWSKSADARIFFGGDSGAEAVHALPHRAGSPFFVFGDHSSLVWADPTAIEDPTALLGLWRTFKVYGKAGCTSPQRLFLIDGTEAEAVVLAGRLKALADGAGGEVPPMHIVSDTLMAEQVARARGCQTARATRGDAVFIAGGQVDQDLPGLMALQILAMSRDAALAAMPTNIQTVGYIAPPHRVACWMRVLADSPALRIVPVRNMHHFGPFWDGQPFWRGLFYETEIRV